MIPVPSGFGRSGLASKKIRALSSILLLSAIVVAGHLIPGLDNSAVQVGIRNALHIQPGIAFHGIWRTGGDELY